MKDLSKHCSDLSKLISGYEEEIDWPNQYEWLNVASGIKRVEFDVLRFNSCFGYCKNADEWDENREKLLESYITELTRFTYIWGALESLINDIGPPPAPERGKINSICFYLRNELGLTDSINPYSKLVNRLYDTLRLSEFNSKVLKKIKKPDYISENGIGLFVVYKIRNLFAHGSLQFPQPDEENRPISDYPTLIMLSSRIVLLSMQMIWLCFYKNLNLKSAIHWEADFDGEYGIESILKKIHLMKPHYDFPFYKQQMIANMDIL